MKKFSSNTILSQKSWNSWILKIVIKKKVDQTSVIFVCSKKYSSNSCILVRLTTLVRSYIIGFDQQQISHFFLLYLHLPPVYCIANFAVAAFFMIRRLVRCQLILFTVVASIVVSSIVVLFDFFVNVVLRVHFELCKYVFT